jgi:CDP-glucose 4,6-dehydratase
MRVDIRNAAATREAIVGIAPEVVLHLAAQPIVRESYLDPRTTYETNTIGTLNVLEAVSLTASVRAHVVITTDKVYRNVNQAAGYVESDALGGDDPYSASKAMADILTQSWVKSFAGPPTAIARAGNVIGGGDVSKDRLIPDLVESFLKQVAPVIRYPDAVRPWQHVLDCLEGYLRLADALLIGKGLGQWNFGPGAESFVPVGSVVEQAAALWGASTGWSRDHGEHPHEAQLLALDSTKAESELNWFNRLRYPESLRWTIDWYAAVSRGRSPREVTLEQLAQFDAMVGRDGR